MVVMLYAFPEAVRLALSIIKTNFGDVNEVSLSICDCWNAPTECEFVYIL